MKLLESVLAKVSPLAEEVLAKGTQFCDYEIASITRPLVSTR
jgi:hypothetical protein